MLPEASQILLIPLNRRCNPSLEAPLRLISQQTLCLADIRVAMLDIAFPVRAVERFHVKVQSLGEAVVDIDQVFTPAKGHVKRLSVGDLGREAGFEVRFDDVLNIGIIPALFSSPLIVGRSSAKILSSINPVSSWQ